MPPLPIPEFATHLGEQVALLRTLVEIESPSTDKPAVDRIGAVLAERLQGVGANVQRHPQSDAGDHWLAEWGEAAGGILMLAHMDTVFPLGTLERIPWREEDEHLRGPGVLDMKASLAMAVTAIGVLQQTGRLPRRRLTLLCTSDEETGSRTSRALIERLAAEHLLVLCLEPALPNGALKTARKGVGIFRLRAMGRAAHAGSNPEQGINAVVEMAHQVLRIAALAEPDSGTTLNVGVIQGGTRSNVVPDDCRARVDVRVDSLEEADRIETAVRGLRPVLPGASLEIEGGLNRPPMRRTPLIAQAFSRAQELGRALGLELQEGKTGGGSDANYVAPLGIPLLDGLGAVGDGAHSEREFVLKRSLPERTALLAALLSEW
jgi:glutamate carboxypeptidase